MCLGWHRHVLLQFLNTHFFSLNACCTSFHQHVCFMINLRPGFVLPTVTSAARCICLLSVFVSHDESVASMALHVPMSLQPDMAIQVASEDDGLVHSIWLSCALRLSQNSSFSLLVHQLAVRSRRWNEQQLIPIQPWWKWVGPTVYQLSILVVEVWNDHDCHTIPCWAESCHSRSPRIHPQFPSPSLHSIFSLGRRQC